jgi:hypothetical protein
LPPKDIGLAHYDVRQVPKADIAAFDPARARDKHCWRAVSSLVHRTQYEVRKTKSPDREIEARSRVYRLI